MNLERPEKLLARFEIDEPFPDRFIRICEKYTNDGAITPEDFNFFMDRITAYRRTLRWISREVSSREIPQDLKYAVCQAAAETVLTDR